MAVDWELERGPNGYQTASLDRSLYVPGYEAHLAGAQRERLQYERSLRSIMLRYEVDDEAELITGCIQKFSR